MVMKRCVSPKFLSKPGAMDSSGALPLSGVRVLELSIAIAAAQLIQPSCGSGGSL